MALTDAADLALEIIDGKDAHAHVRNDERSAAISARLDAKREETLEKLYQEINQKRSARGAGSARGEVQTLEA